MDYYSKYIRYKALYIKLKQKGGALVNQTGELQNTFHYVDELDGYYEDENYEDQFYDESDYGGDDDSNDRDTFIIRIFDSIAYYIENASMTKTKYMNIKQDYSFLYWNMCNI